MVLVELQPASISAILSLPLLRIRPLFLSDRARPNKPTLIGSVFLLSSPSLARQLVNRHPAACLSEREGWMEIRSDSFPDQRRIIDSPFSLLFVPVLAWQRKFLNLA